MLRGDWKRTFTCLEVAARDRLLVVGLARPQTWNALSADLISELTTILKMADEDTRIGAVLLHGTEKAFAAGADLGELSSIRFPVSYLNDIITPWDQIAAFRKPLIAAVRGVALGGGFELAMMADIVVAGTSARFGLPEIGLGLIPGGGGTQRLARTAGKAVAMDLILTGQQITAERAHAVGVVSRLLPDEVVLEETEQIAHSVAEAPQIAAMFAKEAVLAAFETALPAGIRAERRLLQTLFATDDSAEGIAAFQARRPADFKHR